MLRTRWSPAKIAKLRAALHMSQHQFSIAVGCASGQAVSRWERGLNAPCEEFQRALDNLMEGEKR